MKAWWTANGKKLTDQLRPSDPFLQAELEYLEELTGRLPILLRALAAVKVKHPSKGANITMNVDASSNISDIPARLTLLYDVLFKFRYCPVRQCPVLSWWYLPASLFGPRATMLFWCIVFGIWYFLPLTLFFDHVHASSHFFSEISRLRLARDLGGGISRLPYLSL